MGLMCALGEESVDGCRHSHSIPGALWPARIPATHPPTRTDARCLVSLNVQWSRRVAPPLCTLKGSNFLMRWSREGVSQGRVAADAGMENLCFCGLPLPLVLKINILFTFPIDSKPKEKDIGCVCQCVWSR